MLAVAALAMGCGTASNDGGFPSLAGDDASDESPLDDAGTTVHLNLDSGPSTVAPIGDAGCAKATAVAKKAPVYLLFVLDGSDSMSQENKWAAVVPALESIFTQMQSAADPGVAAGLIIFDTGGPFPGSGDVSVAFVDAAQESALQMRLSTAALNLGTPTHAALTGGYGELEMYQSKAPVMTGGKKVLVLITDGVPTDDCANLLGTGSYTTNACVELAAQELVEAPSDGPILTFGVGVGDFPSSDLTDFDPSFLGNLALAGGTGPAGCNPNENTTTSDLCYFEIDPSTATTASQLQQKFETALNAIRGQVASCSFPIQSTGLGTIDPTKVNVEVNGKPILQDPKNGWTYDNPKTPTEILLHGTACSSVTGDVTASVNIVVGCATQAVQ